jgi:cyanophycinase
MRKKPAGRLIVIGGQHDTPGVLGHVADHAGNKPLVIITVASKTAAVDYTRIFGRLGKKVVRLQLDGHGETLEKKQCRLVGGADAIFFASGDQLRLTTKLGGTALFDEMRALYARGGVVAGIGSGAAAMAQTMLVRGSDDDRSRAESGVRMAAGLGFFSGMVIEPSFAEHGRIGRLVVATSMNPGLLGLGIDKDTAMVMHNGESTVIGSGAVFVVDASHASQSSASAARRDDVLSVFGLRLHVLRNGDRFDSRKRCPLAEKRSHAA